MLWSVTAWMGPDRRATETQPWLREEHPWGSLGAFKLSRERSGTIYRDFYRETYFRDLLSGLWSLSGSVVCIRRLEGRETVVWSSLSPKAPEPGAPVSEGRRWTSHLKKRVNLSFLCLFAPFKPSMVWTMPTCIGEAVSSLVYQFKC